MIETRLLYYFLAVAREQNISKAAEVLHLSQPSLSRQMYDLEEIVGKELLIRGNKKTTLTEDGAYFRSKAEEIISLIENTMASLSTPTTIKGNISLGCAETVYMKEITKIIKDIRDMYPDVTFTLYSGNAQDVLEKINQGILDIGLLINPQFFERYEYISLPFYEEYGLLVNENNPRFRDKSTINLDDLKSEPLLVSSQMSSFSGMKDIEAKVENLNVIGHYNLIHNATYLIEEGICSALCIKDLVNENGRGIRFIPIETNIKSPLYIVYKKYQNQSDAMKVFLQEIEYRFKA